MTTYKIQAPNGKTYQIDGPENASQEDIQSQVLTQFPDAGNVPSSTPDAALKNARPGRYKPASLPADPQISTADYLNRYNTIRNRLAAGEKTDEARQIALNRFDSDPRAQQMRKLAGLAPLTTRRNEVRAAARAPLAQRAREIGEQQAEHSSVGEGLAAGFDIGTFGIPQMLAAAGLRFLPSSLTGNKTNLSYHQILDIARGIDRKRFATHPVAGTAGAVGGTIATALATAPVAAAAAASKVPLIARGGNILQSLSTLRKGQRVVNAAKLATIGGTTGGLQAAGTGEDIPTGVVTGAIAAPLVAGGVKVAQVVTRPFRDVLRLSSAGQILSRLTTSTRDALERKAAAYRAATGAEPTLFELLPLADRNRILKQAVVGKDNIVEQTSNAIRARAGNLGPEMSDRARAVLQPNRDAIHGQLRVDIANARGGALAHGDEDMIANAMESPTDMLHLRDEEARAIMAPHEATPVVDNLEDLFPAVPGPGGTRMGVDPEVATVIRSAAGTLRTRASGAGVTAGDITDMMSTLRGDLGKGGIEGRNAERAINHLQGVLDTQAPDAGAAARQMTDAYAARSRMAEGMQEGSATRLRDDVQVGTSRRQARTVRNAYDSPEGASGRALGQGNRIQSDLGGSPEEALRATVKQSRGSTSRQLAQNLGPNEADLISSAARAQDESAQALASASQQAQSGSGGTADAEMLVQAIAGLHPSSFITTKAGALRKLVDMTYIPESRARAMVDMLFSQDPKLMNRALKAIGNEPNGARFVKYLAALTGQIGAEEANSPAEPPGETPPDPVSESPPAEDVPAAGQFDLPEELPAADDQAAFPPPEPKSTVTAEALPPHGRKYAEANCSKSIRRKIRTFWI
jgi:hypothetical protein